MTEVEIGENQNKGTWQNNQKHMDNKEQHNSWNHADNTTAIIYKQCIVYSHKNTYMCTGRFECTQNTQLHTLSHIHTVQVLVLNLPAADTIQYPYV